LYEANPFSEFAVNGTNFPGLDFDIGESYAGLMPIGTSKEELFFWFFPSTNPAASKEIVIWFTGGVWFPSTSCLGAFD
jgi:carboxypeptidase D